MHLHKFEKIWLFLGVGCLLLFLGTVGIQAFVMGHQPPSHIETLDPQKVDQTPPFDHPGLKKIGENTYEVVLVAQIFTYNPPKIHVPQGAKVIFKVTSKDVVHSFTIPGTNVNMMVLPGHVSQKEYTFKEKGNFLVLCNEYCGAGHHMMKMEVEVN